MVIFHHGDAAEGGASPPIIALDRKLEEDALMEEKKESRGSTTF